MLILTNMPFVCLRWKNQKRICMKICIVLFDPDLGLGTASKHWFNKL